MKLISATIPSALAPHCWMVSARSERRKRALPRSMFANATLNSPTKARKSPTDWPYPMLSAPIRSSHRRRTAPGCASFFSGTASASSSSRLSPGGSPLRSTCRCRGRGITRRPGLEGDQGAVPGDRVRWYRRLRGAAGAGYLQARVADRRPRAGPGPATTVPVSRTSSVSSSRSNRTALSSASAASCCSKAAASKSAASDGANVELPGISGIIWSCLAISDGAKKSV